MKNGNKKQNKLKRETMNEKKWSGNVANNQMKQTTKKWDETNKNRKQWKTQMKQERNK